MSTLLVWNGKVGPNWDSTTISNGTIVTNWKNIDGTSTIFPEPDTMDEDVAEFNDGGIHTVGGGGGADQFSITGGTTVTLTGDRYEAGAFQAENNADFPDDLVVDGDSKLIIAGGAGLQNQGTVDVIGLGSDLFGSAGAGVLEIDPGALYTTDALIIGDSTAGVGTVTINGALEFDVVAGSGIGDGAATIGNAGTGVLDITGTPNVFTTSTTLGVNQGAIGAMSLDNSTWGGGNNTLGVAGVGHMTIGAGANVALFSLILGSAQTGSGDLTVTGANSFGVDFLTIGAAGTGTATFEAGSTGTFAAVVVGDSVGAIANMTMDGATWNASTLTIGVTGTGHATAGAGGVVTVNDAVIGSGTDASGDLTIDGAVLNGGTVTIGQDGTGVLAIESGSSGSVAAVVVGEDLGSDGTLTIDDANWNVGSLAVGQTGTGQATVRTGATVTLGTVVIGPIGSLAVTETAGSVGTVIAQKATINFGTLDLSEFGQMLIGASTGTNGAVAIGSNSSLTGLGSLKGDVLLSNGGLVQAIAPVPGALKIDGNITGSGTIQPLMTLEVNGVIDQDVTIGFSPSIAAQVGDLVLDVPGGEQGTITGFSTGNTIDLRGVVYTNAVFTQGTSGSPGTLTLSGGVSSPLSLLFEGNYASDAFTAAPVTLSGAGVQSAPPASGAVTVTSFAAPAPTDTVVTVISCFAAGTRIATAHGPVVVEVLQVGDRVVTADGRIEPIVWIGSRTIDCTRHPNPESVWPVRVAAGTFGENVPVRDLYLSPDHAVFVDGVLVPVKLLINGLGITQVERVCVTYHHVEVARHDMILAEGLIVESYLDVGGRATFQRHGEAIRLFPDFATRLAPRTALELAWETRGAAPLVITGADLAAARAVVAASTQSLPAIM